MAADVSFVFEAMRKGGKDEAVKAEGGGALVTRDLLGGCSAMRSPELDLDSRVPSGWEKKLDLMSGEIYLHRSAVTDEGKAVHDLNFPPPSSSSSFPAKPNDFRGLAAGNLDLTLNLPSAISNHSVCTLEKVRSALERAERRATGRKRTDGSPSSPATSSSTASASSDRSGASDDKPAGSTVAAEQERSTEPMFAAGCPSCLLYVLISGSNPKCPRCGAVVPFPSRTSPAKKPRLDLNYCTI
ncbi:hypothetical protein EJ110_NYTH29217 [Nymphaea thermarum]|nr:hypothetical protein EJ110_NYTH29217 [Nymphaea thermarum]